MVLAAALTAHAAELWVLGVSPLEGKVLSHVSARGGELAVYADEVRPDRVTFEVRLQVVGRGRRELSLLAHTESLDADVWVEGQSLAMFPTEVARAQPGDVVRIRVEASRTLQQHADIPLTFELVKGGTRPAAGPSETLTFESLTNPRPLTMRR